MGKLIDLTGKKFGRLTVIERSYPNTKWGLPRWLCKCSCGTEKVIDSSNLKSGRTKSCGCLVKLPPGVSGMHGLIGCYKASAKRHNVSFELIEKQFKELTQLDCYYCDSSPKQGYGKYIHNGLDRVDNNKGYTIDNVVPCCKQCNHAKTNLTLQEFRDWVKRIYNKMYNKKEEN